MVQVSLALGTSDDAAKRASKLSHRAAMIIGAAAASLAGTPPDRHYKGYIGFNIVGGVFVWIGHGGGCRYTNGSRAGSPRTHHAKPFVGDKLAALGRKLVADGDVMPAAYKALLVKGGKLRGHIADGAACLNLRVACNCQKRIAEESSAA